MKKLKTTFNRDEPYLDLLSAITMQAIIDIAENKDEKLVNSAIKWLELTENGRYILRLFRQRNMKGGVSNENSKYEKSKY